MNEKPTKDEVARAQEIAWRMGTILFTIFLLWFISRIADLHDPVIAGIVLFIALLVAWLSRKYFRSVITEEWLARRRRD